MHLGPTRHLFWAAVATLITALGACAIGAGVMVPALLGAADPWLVVGAGAVAVFAGLTVLALTL